jgi:hypothetical protein
MAMWHRFKPISLEVNNSTMEILNDTAQILYYPNAKELLFEVKYFTESKKYFLGLSIRVKAKFKFTLQHGDFKITVLEQGDEQVKQVKNFGAGALLGAVVAGPLGAAAGAYMGSKRKECPAIISIPKHKIKLDALAPIGYLKEQTKSQFFAKK